VEEKQASSFHIYTFRSAAKIPKQSQHACMPAIRSTCIMLLDHKFIAWWYPPSLSRTPRNGRNGTIKYCQFVIFRLMWVDLSFLKHSLPFNCPICCSPIFLKIPLCKQCYAVISKCSLSGYRHLRVSGTECCQSRPFIEASMLRTVHIGTDNIAIYR